MKKLITSIIILTSIFVGYKVQSQSLLFNEQFNYPVGDSINAHGWTCHNGNTFPISIVSGSLSYTGYPASTGNMLFLNTSGEDDNHSFTIQTPGKSIYAACLINVATATTGGDYFMHLKGSTTSTYTGRIYIKKDTIQNKYRIGLLKGSTVASIVYTNTLYDFATTNLLVLKYTLISGVANDNVALFVNPAISGEGVPTLVATDVSSTDLDTNSQAIALRQGGSTTSPTLNVDEIRVANDWNDAIGLPVGIAEAKASKFNVYPNPTKGKFTLAFDKATDVDIKLFTVDGIMILNKTTTKITSEIDISSYGKGMYFITITDKNTLKTTTEKLIIE